MASLRDKTEVKARYAAERAKRLRPEGNDQYQPLAGKFASLATDPYTPYVAREPVKDHVDFAFVGAGMSGLVVGARLKEAGVKDVRLIDDGWTEISRRIREKVLDGTPLWLARLGTRVRGAIASSPPQRNMERVRAAFEEADFEKMEQIRARVESVVEDPETAEHLKPWYSQLCKRPCFSNEYLPAYNAPNVTLVDTDGKGVERITETGLVVDGKLYEVDCIIYASGFEFGANFQMKTGFDLKGRGGQMLSEYWADGLQTLHGLHMHGFPNAFAVQMNQGANMISNIPHNIVDHAVTIAQIVAHAEQNGFSEVEPTEQAVSDWVKLIMTTQPSIMAFADCTPGFWNNEGQGWSEKFRRAQGHPGGAEGFFRHIAAWRRSGEFAGLMFRK